MIDALLTEAQGFAERLTRTVQSVIGEHCAPFKAIELADALTVSQQPPDGIVLTRDGEPLIRLEVSYLCAWDRAGHFLKVLSSRIAAFPAAPTEKIPYFRYEYTRQDARSLPGAHIHIHDDPGHTSRLTALTRQEGGTTKRARERAQRGRDDRHHLHFPVGGGRFRPALEDVLQILIEEFGVDRLDSWQATLEAGRMDWRLIQTKAVVRDAPDVAAEVLRTLLYTVTPPEDGHPRRHDRALRHP